MDVSTKLQLAMSDLKAVDEEMASASVNVAALPLSQAAARVSQGAKAAAAMATRVLKAAKSADAAASKAAAVVVAAEAAARQAQEEAAAAEAQAAKVMAEEVAAAEARAAEEVAAAQARAAEEVAAAQARAAKRVVAAVEGAQTAAATAAALEVEAKPVVPLDNMHAPCRYWFCSYSSIVACFFALWIDPAGLASSFRESCNDTKPILPTAAMDMSYPPSIVGRSCSLLCGTELSLGFTLFTWITNSKNSFVHQAVSDRRRRQVRERER